MNIDDMRWSEEGDSKKKLILAKYNMITGAYINSVAFANAASQGPGSITVSSPGGLQVDTEGKLYFAGNSAANFPVPPEYTPGTGEEAINPTNNVYCGGPVMAILNASLNKRLFAASFNGGALRCIAIRKMNNTDVMIAAGKGTSSSYIYNALQSTMGGGTNDGYFVIINSPESTSAPAAPTTLTSILNSPTKISFSWTDNATNEDGFIIERKTGAGSFVQVATVHLNTTFFSDISVSGNTAYSYRVKAFNLSGSSSYSNEIHVNTGIPNPPAISTGLSAWVLNTEQIVLQWNDVADEQGYLIEIKRNTDTAYVPVAEVAANTTSHTFSGLKAGTQYYFRMRSFNDEGFSDYSTAISAKTEEMFQHEAINPSNTTQGLCYRLHKHTGTLGVWPDFASFPLYDSGTVSDLDIVAAKDTFKENYDIMFFGYIDIPADGTYSFADYSEKGAMIFIDDSLVLDNGTWKWGPFLKTDGQIGLKAGKHTFVSEFYFTYAKGVYDAQLTQYVEGPGMSFQKIPASMFYRDNSCSMLGSPPAAPSNLSYAIIAGNIVKISWQDNSSNEAGFMIEHTPFMWNTYDPFKEMVRVPKNQTSYVFIHLIPGNTYELRIRAFNAYGHSDYSEVLTFTPTGAIDNKPAPPDQLAISMTGGSQVILRWRDNSFNENGFVVEYKTDSGSYIQAAQTSSGITSITINGLNSNTTYYFRVYAFNSYGNSDYSNEVYTNNTLITGDASVVAEQKLIYVYPNPVCDRLFICGDIQGKAIRVYSVSGLLQELKVSENSLDMSTLPSGLYLVKIGERLCKMYKQ